MPAAKPHANIIIREHRGQPFYEAKFRHDGKQIKRAHRASVARTRPRLWRLAPAAWPSR
jgi:hypothetical protein